MKLAEALQERADLNKKIGDLGNRLDANSLVQEGEQTNEDPQDLMRQLDEAVTRLQKLISDINLTNCKTVVNGKTLTEIIAEKDCAAIRLSRYRSLIESASEITYRARGTEIKIKPAVNVSELQKKADDIAKQIRLLDNTLQATNWTTDLIEK